MKWRTGRRSTNVEDRRGRGISPGIAGGGIGVVVLALVAMFFGVDPGVVLQQTAEPTPGPGAEAAAPPPDDEQAQFVSAVLADTEDTWNAIFRQVGDTYREPGLVLFTQAVQSACGTANSAVGPFYCPLDQKVYIDLSFYRDLQQQLNAPGDFAQAYVIAHEVGHHVQTLLGISDRVRAASQRASQTEANQLSVRQELQADCFAGIWANRAQRERQMLEPGDIDEALTAASAIGDDRLQRQSQGYVVPESFTHGTAAQRSRWFRRGYESGALRDCDTFGSREL